MSKEEIKVKVKDLMSKMTAEEKVAQLACIMPSDLNNPEELGIENGIGAIPILGGMPDQTAEQIQKSRHMC